MCWMFGLGSKISKDQVVLSKKNDFGKSPMLWIYCNTRDQNRPTCWNPRVTHIWAYTPLNVGLNDYCHLSLTFWLLSQPQSAFDEDKGNPGAIPWLFINAETPEFLNFQKSINHFIALNDTWMAAIVSSQSQAWWTLFVYKIFNYKPTETPTNCLSSSSSKL